MRLTVAVRPVPCDCIDIMMVPGNLRTGTACIFPLGFGGQAVGHAPLLLVECAHKCECVVPRNTFYWFVRVAAEPAWIVAHHCFPLCLRDRVFPQIKWLAD